ncbi:MAG: hypothetical protein KDD66_02620 [Bdellovibrionales bacterium]|nr:hypothetical protein [Bdellovibrionales bacterium]
MRKALTIFMICVFCCGLSACEKKWGIPDPGGKLWTTKKGSGSTASPKTTTQTTSSAPAKKVNDDDNDSSPSSLTGAVRPSAQ